MTTVTQERPGGEAFRLVFDNFVCGIGNSCDLCGVLRRGCIIGFLEEIFDEIFDPGKKQREAAKETLQQETGRARGRLTSMAAQTGFASPSRLANLERTLQAGVAEQSARIEGQFRQSSQLGGVLGTLGGALLGSFIAPGVGTAVGAAAGGALFGGGDVGNIAESFGAPSQKDPFSQFRNFQDPGSPRLTYPGGRPMTQSATSRTLFPGLFQQGQQKLLNRSFGVGSRGF